MSNANPIEGSGYGRRPSHSNSELVKVGPGTPGGEYLRRYWHPIAVASEFDGRPKKVRILGENLVLFRDGKGHLGLLHARCAHRGASLYYGRVEEEGIRCCYHGWLFSTQGKCLDQPCEVDNGAHRDAVRQPWYLARERYGLIFGYLGPPDRAPQLPLFDNLENIDAGDRIFAHCNVGVSAYGDPAVPASEIPYNWFQWWENSIDHYHVWILHSTFSVPQFDPALGAKPEVEFRPTPMGAAYHAFRTIGGRKLERVGEAILPNIMVIADDYMERSVGQAQSVTWGVPIDDTSFIIYDVSTGSKAERRLNPTPMTPDGKSWSQMTEAEHQAYPGDFEAQESQGPITLHSEEHLVRSDQGVMMLRRLTLAQIEAVSNGNDPVGFASINEAALIKVTAGNYWVSPSR